MDGGSGITINAVPPSIPMITSRNALVITAVLALAANNASAFWPFKHKGARTAPVEVAAVLKPISRITMELTPRAVDELGEKSRFDLNALQASVEEALLAEGMYHPELKNDGDDLHIAIYKVEFPSKFEALTMGIWSGKNPIAGDVYVSGLHGNAVETFEVTTSHPLRHLAYRKDEEHMQRLYKAFAEKVALHLSGQKVHGVKVLTPSAHSRA